MALLIAIGALVLELAVLKKAVQRHLAKQPPAQMTSSIADWEPKIIELAKVYVFTHTGTTWSQQAYVKASSVSASDLFGNSVALSADGSTLAVGTYQEDSAATGINGDQTSNIAGDSGAVYVFTRTGTT